MNKIQPHFNWINIFIISITFANLLYTQTAKYRFNHLTTDHGLSQGLVHDIIQDHRGFMWFATNDGLNRYDGIEVRNYYNDPLDSLTPSNNTIMSLFEDSSQRLWVGAGGLNLYNRSKDHFVRFLLPSHFPGNSGENIILDIEEDHQFLLFSISCR